jgi:uncharacterized protein (TIGR00375 family)
LIFTANRNVIDLICMRFIADLQIHSKYSRATSPKMVIEELSRWAKIKGIQVLGTGDFTHPAWFAELKAKLKPAEPGLFVYKNDKLQTINDKIDDSATRFMLTAETSHIYSKAGKTRRVHLLIWAPSFEAVAKINAQLSLIGNLRSDGRPILGLDSKELLKIALDADPNVMVIPAHSYTPWFSVFGSMSGFDSLEECFEELALHIHAIETGLSSDPPHSWRNSKLDRVAIVSNSDSHSLERIGREANIFDGNLSYEDIIGAVKNARNNADLTRNNADINRRESASRLVATIEFFPEEGRYHYDGHRDCGVRLSPEETKKLKGFCPKCGKPVTVGVLSRVEELADRPAGYAPENRVPYKNLVPLDEIIAEALGVQSKTKKVYGIYHKLCASLGGELPLLLEAEPAEIARFSDERVAEGVRRVREGKLSIAPGYDGEYGRIKIFGKGEDQTKETPAPQQGLF